MHFIRQPTVTRIVQRLGASVQLASLFCTIDVLKLSNTESDNGKDPDGTLLMPSYRAARFLSKILIRTKARPTRCKNRPFQFHLELLLSDHLQRGVLAEEFSTTTEQQCRIPFPVLLIDSESIRKHYVVAPWQRRAAPVMNQPVGLTL